MIELFPWAYVWLCYLRSLCFAMIVSSVLIEHYSRFKAREQTCSCSVPILPSLSILIAYVFLSAASQRVDSGSITGRFPWGLWWIQLKWTGFIPPPEHFISPLSVELHRATVLNNDSCEQTSYFCLFSNRSVLGTGKKGKLYSQRTVPWYRLLVAGRSPPVPVGFLLNKVPKGGTYLPSTSVSLVSGIAQSV